MRYVDPIKDKDVLNDVADFLKHKEVKTQYQEFLRDRNYLMFYVGIYSGLRISDILPIKAGDLIEDRIEMNEKKTGKQKTLFLNDNVIREIKKYIKKYDLKRSDYLFASRKKNADNTSRPLGRQGAYDFIKKDIQNVFKNTIGGTLATHTLRKTFGYHYYMKTKDIVMLQKLFNHSDPKITLRYIGIEKDEQRVAMKSFNPLG